MTRYLCPVLLFTALLTTTNARAQDAAQIELAKRHFELGKAYYAQAAYQRALEAFKESHRLSGKAALLFNIGKCYEALGNLPEAITSYRQYLESTAQSDPNIEARIKNLERRLESERTAVPDSQPAGLESTPTPPPPPVRRTDRPIAGSGPNWIAITGWSLLGVGAASVATGIAMGALARSRASDVEQAYKDGNRDWADIKGLEDEGKSFDIGMIVGLSVGIAAAGGGAALLYFAHRREHSVSRRTMTIAPLVHGDSVGLTAALRY